MSVSPLIQGALKFRLEPTVRRSLMVCCIVVVIGTAGYTWIEGWSAWQSLFFTLVTLTTVGYGDYGLSEQGERFTAVLMIGGIASVSYAVSQFIQHATSCVLQPEQRMLHRANQMSGHYILCGLGRTGQRVINLLREEGIEFVAIDMDEHLVEQARNDGVVALCGDATSDRVLLDAGLENAESIGAVTSNDSVNAMICLTSRALCSEIKISARAEGDDSVRKLKRAGADFVINPARFGGDGIAQSFINPKIANLIFECGEDSSPALQFSEVVVDHGSRWIGQRIIDLGKANPGVVIVGIVDESGGFTMRPNVNRILTEGDIIFIAGSLDHVKNVSMPRMAA